MAERIKPYVPNPGENETVKKAVKQAGELEDRLLEGTNVYQYGGYREKEARERMKQQSLEQHLESEPTREVPENPK